uniref:Uncharacterized protein n=1 Tax=Ditylenchus dipsaci TaxID=166011 RepID=A0A915EN15_9BILA
MMPMAYLNFAKFQKESPTATFKNNFESFFTDITSVGRLKHFDTNAHLSTDVLCQGIFNCRPLKFLSWKKYQPIDYGLIFQTLDQMHKGELSHAIKAPSHAYVKFYKTMQTSRVMRAAQFSNFRPFRSSQNHSFWRI